MAVTFERRVSSMAEWARRISGFSLVLLVTAGLGHRYGLVETPAFLWTLGLVILLAIIGLALAAGGFTRLWLYGDKAGIASFSAVLLSILALAPFGASAWLYLHFPALTDITTAPERPPHFISAPQFRDGQMNQIVPISSEAAALQIHAYPDLTGRRFDASPDRVLAAMAPVIASFGWKVRGHLPSSTHTPELSIEMEAPSYLLRLPADVVVRLVNGEESVFIDMRMAVRYGPHDLGAIARRIHAFMTALEAELERQSLQIIDIPASDGEVDPVD